MSKPGNSSANSLVVYDLWRRTNSERAEVGVSRTALDERLNASALAKCQDMATKDYWSHNSPEGTEPWVFIKKTVSEYDVAAENLYKGNDSVDEAISGWMNSKTHKDNILDKRFTNIGFGICKNKIGETLIVQHFVK
jgi:uncharacterized protein YkwD